MGIIPGKLANFTKFITHFGSEKLVTKISYHIQKRKTEKGRK